MMKQETPDETAAREAAEGQLRFKKPNGTVITVSDTPLNREVAKANKWTEVKEKAA